MYKVKGRDRIDNWRRYLLHIECVRRNPEYQKEYEKLMKERPKEEAENVPWTYCRELIARRWGLFGSQDIPDPKASPTPQSICKSQPPKSFSTLPLDESVDRAQERALTGLSLHEANKPAEMKVPTSMRAGLLFLTYFPEENPDQWERIVFNLRRSKQDLTDTFGFFLNHWIIKRREAGLRQNKANRRYHLRECLRFLEVYDLRGKGQTFRQIGEALWPDSAADVEYKAREHFRKGRHLILTPPLL